MKIGFLTTFGQTCPFADYAQNLTQALIKLGHEVYILSPMGKELPGTVPSWLQFTAPMNSDAVDRMVNFLKEKEINTLLVQPEAIGENPLLEKLIDQVNTFARTVAILHSTNYSPAINYRVFTRCLMPHPSFQPNPPGARTTGILPFGVVEYTTMEQLAVPIDRYDWRVKQHLPGKDSLLLFVFAGKTDLSALVRTVGIINSNGGTKPIQLLIHSWDMNNQQVIALANEHDFVHASLGYMDQERLLLHLDACDAVFTQYTAISKPFTSSVLKLAIAAETVILTNKGPHTLDVAEFLPELDDAVDISGTIRRIVNILSKYETSRRRQKINSSRAKDQLSWTKVAQTLVDTF